jgi:ethanolamine utilization cobalamin adenosyltransferase
MMADDKKPEHMTSLYGNILVPKTHGRIVFRGLVDTLQAEVIEAQVMASSLGETEFCGKLGEILNYLRALMAAEVKETPLPPPFLFGMDAEEIHRRSHKAFMSDAEGKLVLPDYTHGPLVARLNTLRAKTREVELCSVKVFGEEKKDIILALNRLSSALWLLTCQWQNKP